MSSGLCRFKTDKMRELVVHADSLRARAMQVKPSWSYRLGWLVITRFHSVMLAVMLLMAINVFYGLSTAVVSDMDEARYGVAASEMLDAHDWLVPTYGGQPEYWNLKPPLGYWLIQASYSLFGRSVFALRLPSALCALGVVFFTMMFARRWFGSRVAILSGLFTATCFGFLSHHGARSGDLDAQLTLIAALLLMQVPSLGTSYVHRLLFGVLFAVAFLLKSFAIMPFAVATCIYLMFFSGEQVRLRDWLPSLVVFVSIVGTWMLIRSWHDGTAYFVVRMTYEDLFMRATSEIDNGSSYSPWRYAASLFDRFAPWPFFMALGWLYQFRARTRPSQPAYRLVMLWALAPLCLFSLAHTHHHWYLDPAYPAFAMLSAIGFVAIIKWQSAERSRALLVVTLAVMLIACETRVLMRCIERDRMPPAQLFLASLGKFKHHRGTQLRANYPLSHSERFILQVICGFDVTDSSQSTLTSAAITSGVTLFKASSPAEHPFVESTHAVLAEHNDLLLIGNSFAKNAEKQQPEAKPAELEQNASRISLAGNQLLAIQGQSSAARPGLRARKSGGDARERRRKPRVVPS